MENLSNLIEDQRSLLKNLQRTAQTYRSKTNITRGYAQGVLEEIESSSSTFKTMHTQLLEIVRENSFNLGDIPYFSEEVYHKYQDEFLILKGQLIDAINDPGNSQSPTFCSSTFATAPHSRNETVIAEARLPKIDLPVFSGDYVCWISYRDMFMSLVHNNQALSNVQKYYFLKSSCSGTPLDIVNEYPASDANYILAWNALNSRYHNTRKIVDTLMRKLFSIPPSNGSAESIQVLLDTTRNCLALLRTMGVNSNGWDAILVYMSVNKLDNQTRKEWEQSLKASTEVPTIAVLFEFLETSFRTLETISEPQNLFQNNINKNSKIPYQHRPKIISKRNVHVSTTNNDNNCPCCDKRHLLFKCFKFAAMSSDNKKTFLNDRNVCRNCLNIGHWSNQCSLKSNCQICQKRHHTTLHSIYANFKSTSNNPVNSTSKDEIGNIVCNCNSLKTQPQILLATVRVVVKTPYGIFNLRAILDQCAQASFITQYAAEILKLPKIKTHAQISGVCGKDFTATKLVQLTLSSNNEKDFQMVCQTLVLPKITAYQPQPIDANILSSLKEYKLADPSFTERGEIDMLLGGDVYGDIVLPQQRRFNNCLLLQLTHFGWVVSGPTTPVTFSRTNINVNVCALDQQLREFWEQEEILEKRHLTEEEELCEQYFKRTFTRDSSGRYTVCLPFKSALKDCPLPLFSHTDYTALLRLKNVEAKCERNPTFGKLYRSFMKEYEDLGHMVRQGRYPQNLKKNGYFLPHHGVLRESSSTTKLRVVFDGSSSRTLQSSLNEELVAGPALQNDLPVIITRWRRFRIGFTADIEKMFRQINVTSEHQKYQQILWRDSDSNDLYIYNLSTVTYGTKPAPYLSIRVLQQLAIDEKERFPSACKILNSDIYVDDVISGADDFPQALQLHLDLCKLLNKGKFNLRKWTSNSEDLLKSIPSELRDDSNIFEIENDNFVKALGLRWNPRNDYFSFKIQFEKGHEKVTKRSLLSDAAKLYDPLGWLSPTTILAKIEFQNLWLLGINWDDFVPENLRARWTEYKHNLIELEKIKIPRWIGHLQSGTIEIHGFCDSSKLAFAAVVYSKIITNDSAGKVCLLQAKTKVGPLKRLTIPRMELCGATLLVKLVNKIISSIDSKIANIYYWTDSTTALSWIRGQSSKWPVFVGNRVAEIQRRSNNSQWRYISTKENPADCASRGISASELVSHKLWWNGPKWLSDAPENWPLQPLLNFEDSQIAEKRACLNIHSTINALEYPEILTRFSSFNKLIRVTAYIFRFKNNLIHKIDSQKEGSSKMTGFLTSSELHYARMKLIIISQKIDFPTEMLELKKHGHVYTNRSIAKLCPFLDSSEVMRVGGRIHNSDLKYSSKHPILLSKQNPLNSIIFLDAHKRTLHGGLTQVLSFVSREYWILSARNIAKKVLRQCIVCFKYNAKAAQQIMGSLPSVRLKPARPFKHSGVDYAGPITIKQSTARNTITSKGYICLFICMVTKALHLEAVSSLSTDSFLAAFRRFTSRRGNCTDIYSDCGTNFVGAEKELNVLYKGKSSLPKDLADILASDSVTWHFIPPASPNFGGLWEAGVKSTKHHLRRVMHNRILTFEELTTLLAQIESCLNSRPLCPLNNDPSDVNALTPAHFLIGESSVCVPEQDLLNTNIDRLSRWKVVEKLKQHFWRRWSKEWLCRLQARPKWLKVSRNAEVGDLVIIFDERCPPGQWPLARIQAVHPGTDGFVRVVTLSSNGKLLKRPISKIAFLPNIDPLCDNNTS